MAGRAFPMPVSAHREYVVRHGEAEKSLFVCPGLLLSLYLWLTGVCRLRLTDDASGLPVRKKPLNEKKKMKNLFTLLCVCLLGVLVSTSCRHREPEPPKPEAEAEYMKAFNLLFSDSLFRDVSRRDVQAAAGHYRKALSIDPDYTLCRTEYAMLLLANDSVEQAWQLIDNDRNDAGAAFLKGLICHYRGQMDGRRQAFERAASLLQRRMSDGQASFGDSLNYAASQYFVGGREAFLKAVEPIHGFVYEGEREEFIDGYVQVPPDTILNQMLYQLIVVRRPTSERSNMVLPQLEP